MASVEGLPDRVLLWSDNEAKEKQAQQVGNSTCGATAALNVLVRNESTILFLNRATEILQVNIMRKILLIIITISFNFFFWATTVMFSNIWAEFVVRKWDFQF